MTKSSSFQYQRNAGYFINTPLIPSHLPNVWLKLDNLQRSGSFKDRGIGNMMWRLSANKNISQFICSSGGNAGMAVTFTGRLLQKPVQVFVPTTTMPFMVDRLRHHGGIVHVGGSNWNEADTKAQDQLSSDPNAQYIPPFDHPLIWDGHSSLVEEIASAGDMPDAIVVSVGGGGLLRGIQLGLERGGYATNTEILAVETEGAASFAVAKTAGRVVRLPAITSVATSLGALSVMENTLESKALTTSYVVNDIEAVSACLRFANDHRMLVEPACGAALSLVYSKRFEEQIKKYKRVVVVVCGGSGVTLDLLEKWKHQLSI